MLRGVKCQIHFPIDAIFNYNLYLGIFTIVNISIFCHKAIVGWTRGKQLKNMYSYFQNCNQRFATS